METEWLPDQGISADPYGRMPWEKNSPLRKHGDRVGLKCTFHGLCGLNAISSVVELL